MLLHEDYQLYVLPRILESKKMAKSGRTKQKEADLEYSVAKQVEKMIRYTNSSIKFKVKLCFSWEFKELDWEGNLPFMRINITILQVYFYDIVIQLPLFFFLVYMDCDAILQKLKNMINSKFIQLGHC